MCQRGERLTMRTGISGKPCGHPACTVAMCAADTRSVFCGVIAALYARGLVRALCRILIAAVIGIPIYIRAAAVIPLSGALIAKGMALGSVMALIIGSAGASLTEVILLRSLFKTPMIVAFLLIVLGMAISAGFMFNLLF